MASPVGGEISCWCVFLLEPPTTSMCGRRVEVRYEDRHYYVNEFAPAEAYNILYT